VFDAAEAESLAVVDIDGEQRPIWVAQRGPMPMRRLCGRNQSSAGARVLGEV